MKRVGVFCGSAMGSSSAYRRVAVEVGEVLVERGLELVYGGGRVGLMGVLADTVLSRGGNVIGVMPALLVRREIAHHGLSELRVVGTMHERKAAMIDLADAFIAMPGGFGTIEEFCEVLTWSQIGLHQKPCGLLNVARYYDPLIAFFQHAVDCGFLPQAHRGLIIDDDSPARLLSRLAAPQPLPWIKWTDAQQQHEASAVSPDQAPA